MFKLQNPFPKQLVDTSKLQNMYKEYNLVPYAGTTGQSAHRLLKVLKDMPQLSPTHGSCINDLAKWCFRGNVGFSKSEIPGLDIQNDDLGDGEKSRIAREVLKFGITPTLIQQVTEKAYKGWKKTGDLYIRYKEVTVGGTRQVFVEAIDPMRVMYLNTLPGEVQSAVISSDFFSNEFTFKESKPELLRVFPFVRGEVGQRETLIHVKNEDEESLWYGRPDTMQVLYWMAVEWFQALHSLKVSKTETVAKAIITMMNPQPQGMGQGESVTEIMKMNRVEINRLMTNKGKEADIDSIGVIGYPFEGEKPDLLKLDINRDTAYLKQSVATASDYITAAHGWSKILMGFDRPSSGIGGNVLIDEFATRNTSTIKPTQRYFEYAIWGKVFGLLSEFSGIGEIAQVSPRFEDRVKSLVESLNEQKKNGIQANITDTSGSGGTDGGEPPATV